MIGVVPNEESRGDGRWDPAAGRRFLRFAFLTPIGLAIIVGALVLAAVLPTALKTVAVLGGVVLLVGLARRKGVF